MNASLARIEDEKRGFGRRRPAERRREERFAVGFKGRLHSSRGDKEKVLIADVSVHGCQIRTEATWLRVGSIVGVSVENGDKQGAIVRWVREGAAGMEFLRPLAANAGGWADLLDSPV